MAFRRTISFTDLQADDIRRYADRLGIPFAEQVRRIVDQWRVNIAGPPYPTGLKGLPAGPVTYQHYDRVEVLRQEPKPLREKEPKP